MVMQVRPRPTADEGRVDAGDYVGRRHREMCILATEHRQRESGHIYSAIAIPASMSRELLITSAILSMERGKIRGVPLGIWPGSGNSFGDI
jgi:hypothetical protein